MKKKISSKAVFSGFLIVAVALVLGLFTTYEYVTARGLNYLEEGKQIVRLEAVLAGHAGDPWQFRVLASYLAGGVIGILSQLQITHPVAVSFILIRVIQDACILILAYKYYRKLGIPLTYAFIGMALLAWSMSYSHFDSDLQFNTFFDIIFYLAAGLCILYERYFLIIPLMVFAALNRETSGLIPFLLLVFSFFALPRASLRKVIPVFISSLVIYVVIFFGLRFFYGYQAPIYPYGHKPGLDLLTYNLFRRVTWLQLLATLNIIPIVAIINFRNWPQSVRLFFWTIVPFWILIHAFGAVMAEARLFLVPQAMVLIPGALALRPTPAAASDTPPVASRP